MVRYRRYLQEGGSYFFTVAIRDRRDRVLTDHVHLLRCAFHTVQAKSPFTIDAIVVLPDHLHTVWTLPEGDAHYPGRWRAIKSLFVRLMKREGLFLGRNGKGDAPVWQRRYWEHALRNDDDRQRHIDYIHYNPVKHGYVQRPADWPYSSIHRFIARGDLPADWGGPVENIEGRFGE